MNKVVQLFWGQFFDYVFVLLKPSHILFISYSFPIQLSILIYFLFNFYSFLIYFLFTDEEEKKAKASKDPIPNPQYICQYKTQPIVPNTFSNKESIAHKESLHNQLKKFIPFPSIVEGGGFTNPFSTLWDPQVWV